MKKIDPKALKEIRFILEGIKSGRLAHWQSSFHVPVTENELLAKQFKCGTAHCVAGWCTAINIARERKMGLTKLAKLPLAKFMALLSKFVNKHKSETEGLENPFDDRFTHDHDTWDAVYARYRWGINLTEALLIFDGSTRLDQMFDLLTHWEAGERVKYQPSASITSMTQVRCDTEWVAGE